MIPPTSGIIMMAAIYYGAMYGGSTTAIVVNIPGEASSVPTAIDGYEMAKPIAAFFMLVKRGGNRHNLRTRRVCRRRPRRSHVPVCPPASSIRRRERESSPWRWKIGNSGRR